MVGTTGSPAPVVDRGAVLAHRWRAQELHRPATGRAGSACAVTALGVADVPAPAAASALAVRGAAVDGGLALVWGARGAPALHRRGDLARLAAATWPLDDADAAARVPAQVAGAAALGVGAFTRVALAVREVLAEGGPAAAPGGDGLDKAALSAGVTRRVPAALSHDCAPCGARHVSGALLQAAGLAGGAELVRTGRGTRFRLLAEVTGPPERASGTEELVRRYLALLGPAPVADVAAYLGASARALRAVWPADAVELRVRGGDGRERVAFAAGALPDGAPSPRGVRLLPPGDPWLQARDRDLTVPGRERQRQLWRPVGAPGAVLVDGEVAGTWRASARGRRLLARLAPWDGEPPLDERVRAGAEAELPLLAAARGLERAALEG